MPGTPFRLYDWCAGLLPGTTLQVRLYQSGPPFTYWPALSDFVEASFAGYGSRVPDPGLRAQQLGSGYLYWQCQPLSFVVASNIIPGCNVNGWYINSVDGLGNMLVACWGSIKPQQVMQQPGNYFVVQPSFSVLQMITPAN